MPKSLQMNVKPVVLMIYEMTCQMPTVQLPEVEDNSVWNSLVVRRLSVSDTNGEYDRLCERCGTTLFPCDDESS